MGARSDADNSAGRWREYGEAHEHALEHARRGNAPAHVVARLAAAYAQALLYGPTPVPEAIARIEELLADVGPDRVGRAWFYASLAGLRAMQGDFDEARRVSEETDATLAELGQLRNRAEHAYVSANIELLAGDLVAAESTFRTARETLRSFDVPSSAMGALLADVLCTLGRLEDAEALAHEVSDSGQGSPLVTEVVSRTAMARVLVRRSELEEAERLVREALILTDRIEFPGLRAMALTAASEVAEADGRAADARELLEEARSDAEAKGNVVMLERLEAALAAPVR